jgi:hypothetical protein
MVAAKDVNKLIQPDDVAKARENYSFDATGMMSNAIDQGRWNV